MNNGLKYSIEEVHEMHKRIILDGIFAMQHDDPKGMISVEDVGRVFDAAERVLNQLDDRGLYAN